MLKAIFSDILNTELKTINNSIIELGDIDDSGKGRPFKSRFIKDGLVKIEGHGIVLIKKETLDSSLSSMIGTPVIIKHQKVTDENADELRVGIISDAYFNEPDGWYYCEGVIWDKKAQKLIEQKGWSVSCSYDFLAYNDEGGEENNIKYDKEFTKLNFVHLALVNNPRYERANIVFNCKVDNDRWITIKPHGDESDDYRRLKLEDGETPKEAIERTYGKKDKISKDYKENTSHYGKKEHQEEIISLYEGLKNPNKSEARKKEDRELLEHHLKELNKYSDTSDIHLSDEETKRENKIKEIKKELNKKQSDKKEENKDKYIGKKFFIGDREDEITEYLPQFDRYMGKNPEGLNWGAQLYTKEDLDKFVKSDGEYLEEKELREKQKVEREQAQKQKEEEKKATQAEYMRDNGFTEGMTDLQKGKTLKDLNKEVWYKQINDGKPTTSKKMIEELIGKGFKPKEETFRTSKKINGERIDKDTVSKILEDKDGNFYKLNSTEYKYAQYLQDKGKDIVGVVMPINAREQSYSKTVNNEIEEELTEDKNQLKLKIDNSKEQEMALIEELKKLITKVENTKGEKDMEIENGKVDKRKLIDEVAGIMKSAGCDDEDIRTAIGKMEKIGYDKSEDDTADNCGGKKVKNEEEPKEVKNEEKEEPEKDKKEVEEVKEEIKEDVGNKCDNSKSSFDKINGIYNSIKQVAQGRQFVSRQDKLDNAVEYFK